ncbi:MAG: hypothetical protein LRS48_04305 [Desulfurococcales archaeon]|nr:hypothetical protein [Desulfurococcales archaeon]
MTRKVVSEKSITWAEAMRLLQERVKDETSGVVLIQERTLEYLKTVSLLDAENAERLAAELETAGIPRDVAVVIANICPQSPGEVRSILEMDKEKKYDEELVNKILEIVSKYCGSQSEA